MHVETGWTGIIAKSDYFGHGFSRTRCHPKNTKPINPEMRFTSKRLLQLNPIAISRVLLF